MTEIEGYKAPTDVSDFELVKVYSEGNTGNTRNENLELELIKAF